ncbi:hypothetical protein GX645_06195 [Candidatus Sumerlaeota bacterium]|nr:ATP-binding protein [Candidatus Sumerlaeales bacterium]NLD62028.1 hypothetical protein [Candidatus Sumerlaeota bacterium]
MINAFAFACQVTEGVPGCSALYLTSSDLLVPNNRWVNTFGTMSRLNDLERLGLSVDSIRENIIELTRVGNGEFTRALDEESIRTLVITAIPNFPQMFFIFLHDETEAHKVAAMRRDFIANVSHELRTPLTIIRGYVETLMDPDYRTPEALNEYLPIILDNTKQMHTLIIDLMDLSRLESSGARRLAAINLKTEIEGAIASSRVLAKEKKIKIIHAKLDAVDVQADVNNFPRVLINLIENAIKYTPNEGTIRIYTELDNSKEHVTVHITDNGMGIPNDDQERIFERFYRVRGTTASVRGSGLGLAIVKHALQLMDSEIKLNSTLGEGSDFYFTLKVFKNPDETAQATMSEDVIPRLSHR